MCFGDVCVYLGTSVRLSLTDSNHIPILIFKTDILGNFFCFEPLLRVLAISCDLQAF